MKFNKYVTVTYLLNFMLFYFYVFQVHKCHVIYSISFSSQFFVHKRLNEKTCLKNKQLSLKNFNI